MGCYEGTWSVDGRIFGNKVHALTHAGGTGKPVRYHFYDELWESFDRSQLGRVPLGSLYRQRAQQLRDSYDYLVLYYSGGADSRNVLHTFLDNGIPLDCICVKWPVSAVGKDIYPITHDPDSINFMCEWDLVIKPDLEWIARRHPGIRIEIVDWLDRATQDSFRDRSFEHVNQFTFMTNILRIPSHSLVERDMCDRGLRVAGIYGVDKPIVRLRSNGNAYMIFRDTATTVNPVRAYNPHGTEYFYQTPDMPLVAFEQAYQVMRWLENRPRLQHLFETWVDRPELKELGEGENHSRLNRELEIVKSVIYPKTYDPTIFQAEKPLRGLGDFLGNSKDFYLETHPELAHLKAAWQHTWTPWIGQIETRFMKKPGWFNPLSTKPFYLGTIRR